MASGTHRNWFGVDSLPVVSGSVSHRSRCEIHLSCHHSDVWEGDIIEWHIILGFRPAALFHTENTLVVEDVRIGAVQTYRFVDAVQVEDEMMLGCAGSQAFHHFDGGLVVAVHEIHLESLDAHISIGLADGFQVLVHHVEYCPKHDIHALALTIFYELRQLDIVYWFQNASLFRVVPSFIKDDVFQAVIMSKIYVIFVSIEVDACLEIHTFQIPVVPPVPGHLARFDPGSIAYFVGSSQGVHQIAGWHLGIVLCDGEDAPRIIAFAGAGCDVIAGALYVAHVSPRVVGHLLRVGSKGGSQDSLLLILFAAVSLQPHARILLQVAFQDSDFRLSAIYGCREESQILLSGIEPCFVIDILESHGKRLFWSRSVWQPCFLVLAKLVGGGFIQDDGLAFSLGIESVSHSLIVSSQDDAETILQFQIQFLISCFKVLLTIEWRMDGFLMVAKLVAYYLRILTHVHSIVQRYTY